MTYKGTQAMTDIANMLRARNTLLWITTREEIRVERAIVTAAGSAEYETRFWDCATGLTASDGKPIDANLQDPQEMIRYIRRTENRAVYVLRDLHKWFDPMVLRGLRSLQRMLQGQQRDKARAVLLLTPSGDVPPELCDAKVIEYPLPDRAEMATILDGIVERSKVQLPNALDVKQRDAAIDAVVGLTAEDAAACYSKSLVTLKRIDPALISNDKKGVIAKERVLTWYDPDPRGFGSVGGLDILKPYAQRRKLAFSAKAREYGLQYPKGVLCVGVSGCGKSQFAKAIAGDWGQVLLRLDMGALQSKWVGESQANIRRAFKLAEAVAPSVLWIDEIEKALAGSSGAQGDGGVSSDALGALLTWMQEREAPVYVVATSNDVSGLPPELLRKGRFDDVFFVDLPTAKERAEVLAVSLRQHGRDVETIDIGAIVRATEGFTGAEIFQLVPDALFTAFEDKARALRTDDLIGETSKVVPLSRTAKEKIDALRDWAKTRARPASTPDVRSEGASERAIEL